MDKIAKPDKFDIAPTAPQSGNRFKLWLRGFKYFITTIQDLAPDKLEILFLHIGPNVFEIIQDAASYDAALRLLEEVYIKPPNVIFARHLLSSRFQKQEEGLDEFLQALVTLAHDCNFTAITAEQNKNSFIRDSFIRGLKSNHIRQRLLENKTLTLDEAIQQSRALEQAQATAESYNVPSQSFANAAIDSTSRGNEFVATSWKKTKFCFFCGSKTLHPRVSCPAKNSQCHKCRKTGHWSLVCRSSTGKVDSSAAVQSEDEHSDSNLLASICSASGSLHPSIIDAILNNVTVQVLIDTGSSENFISEKLAKKLNLKVFPKLATVSMASSNLTTQVLGCCSESIVINEKIYDVKLSILPTLCADVILGLPFLKLHKEVRVTYHGSQPAFVCGLTKMKLSDSIIGGNIRLFQNLTPDCIPITTKPRQFSSSDRTFISEEISKMLKEGVIEPANTPWRAQIVVVSGNAGKKRLVVDFSQTINRFTELDAYPVPRIEEIVNEISKNKVYSKIDLSSAYYQVGIIPEERPYTGFQADGGLYQFCRVPMGVKNGVSVFQRVMNSFIKDHNLSGTFSYLDDIIIVGSTQEEHDLNLRNFLHAAKLCNMTINQSKCALNLTTINFLGYHISQNELRPDPERLRPIKELSIPQNHKELQRVLGFYAYYAKWIPKYSFKLRPLVNTGFPLSKDALDAMNLLNNDIINATIGPIRDDSPFTIETDASSTAIAATLCQDEKPVAFFSRSLNKAEQKYHIVEKEAYAVIEAVRKWRHFLTKHFYLITDQRSVSFMFDDKNHGKIKNDKILRWRIELSAFYYTIKFRPGDENAPADALSRCCSMVSLPALEKLHQNLVHPGIRRMLHYVKTRNLPYSIEEIRKVTSQCSTCLKIKPQFYKPPDSHLIKATSPFERISIDFKGPLPRSNNSNCYLLMIVDEYSRFPFAYPCRDVSTATVIRCLTNLFSIFGMASFVHSDRGASFMSRELKLFLTNRGVATSRTTPYHPQGNSQCERYNGIVWNTIKLALESKGVKDSQWDMVLPDALHAIRSLLNTSTNETPHERLFGYTRRTATGATLPTWLCNPGQVYLRNFVRQSKSEPLVRPVELIEANPQYAYIKYPDGREDTVSIRDLAPAGHHEIINFPKETTPDSSNRSSITMNEHNPSNLSEIPLIINDQQPVTNYHQEIQSPGPAENVESSTPTVMSPQTTETRIFRRSQRTRYPVQRLNL